MPFLFPQSPVFQQDGHDILVKLGMQLSKILEKGQRKKVDEVDSVSDGIGDISIQKRSYFQPHGSFLVTLRAKVSVNKN